MGEPWARGHFVTSPLWFLALWTLQTANTTEGISGNARVGYRFCQGKLFRGREIQGRVERMVGYQMDRQMDGQIARGRREEPKSGCICFTN